MIFKRNICNNYLEFSRSGQLHVSRAWWYWDHGMHSFNQLIRIFENDTFILHKNVVRDFGQKCMWHLAPVLSKVQLRIRRGWYHCNRSISSVTNPHWYLKFEIVTCILHRCVTRDFGINIYNIWLECSRSGHFHFRRAWYHRRGDLSSLNQFILIFKIVTFIMYKNTHTKHI